MYIVHYVQQLLCIYIVQVIVLCTPYIILLGRYVLCHVHNMILKGNLGQSLFQISDPNFSS